MLHASPHAPLAPRPRIPPLSFTHTHARTYASCTAYFSVGYLLNTFYLGALNELMYSKGDARLTSDTNSWDDFIFRRAGSLINGCGFLFQVRNCTLISAWQARRKQRGGVFTAPPAHLFCVLCSLLLPVCSTRSPLASTSPWSPASPCSWFACSSLTTCSCSFLPSASRRADASPASPLVWLAPREVYPPPPPHPLDASPLLAPPPLPSARAAGVLPHAALLLPLRLPP